MADVKNIIKCARNAALLSLCACERGGWGRRGWGWGEGGTGRHDTVESSFLTVQPAYCNLVDARWCYIILTMVDPVGCVMEKANNILVNWSLQV